MKPIMLPALARSFFARASLERAPGLLLAAVLASFSLPGHAEVPTVRIESRASVPFVVAALPLLPRRSRKAAPRS